MKKITLLLLLAVTFGYSQTVIEDFEGTAPTVEYKDGMSGSISSTQAIGTNSLEIISAASGAPWQQAELTFQGDWLDLTTTKSVDVEVYSTTPFNVFAKVVEFAGTGPDSATSTAHGGTGWETITLTFDQSLDGTGVANDAYGKIFFYYNWVGNNAGTMGGNNNWQAPADGTFYVDNITGMSVPAPATCSDGIMNQDETGIDCGGTICSECLVDPSGPAPNPSTPDAEVLSIYGDTGGFTNIWVPDYSFGATQGQVDFGSGTVNNAIKMDFSDQGYGQGTNAPVDISAYDWVHFDYYAPTSTPGVNGHEMKFILIGNGEGEKDYVFKTDGSGDDNLVFDSWQSVDINLSHFIALGLTKPNYLQYKLGTTSNLNTSIVYFDNIYFSVNQGTLGTDDFSKNSFKTYPNPTQDSWTIETQNVRIASITVFDVLGKSVMAIQPNEDRAVVDGSSLKSGLYFAKVETAEGVSSVKLIKK